jgi:uncharacterized protein YutE (UPF0331/DUF86 family)
MYYVNREQISERLAFVPVIAEGVERLKAARDGGGIGLVDALAQERLLHLAIEAVTDVGSLLIDGFLMRDASSYEDIVDILVTEGVFSAELGSELAELVRLRKPLVQDYYKLDRQRPHPLFASLDRMMAEFAEAVNRYLLQELGPERG